MVVNFFQGKLAILSAQNCFISVDDETSDVVAVTKKAEENEILKVILIYYFAICVHPQYFHVRNCLLRDPLNVVFKNQVLCIGLPYV